MGSIRIEESGPLRVILRATHQLSKTSHLDQKIIITAGSNQVVFENDLFWKENRKILKVQFPVAVASDGATFETQYGVLQRPTHNNSSWDIAKFEVCAHKFCDLSEFGYGVALLNDCKYGFSVRGNVMSMSILRSPKAPDDKCDMGRHTFNYALQIHKGTFLESNVVQNGYEFNTPVLQMIGGLSSPSLTTPLFSVDQQNIVIDAVKKSEDGNCIVVRMYESMGGRGSVKITCAFEFQKVSVSNVLEDALEELAAKSGTKDVTLDFTPFQVMTLVYLAK
jgi:alpha-mannosidase